MGKSIQIALPFMPVMVALGIVGILGFVLAGIESAKARRDDRHWLTGKPL